MTLRKVTGVPVGSNVPSPRLCLGAYCLMAGKSLHGCSVERHNYPFALQIY